MIMAVVVPLTSSSLFLLLCTIIVTIHISEGFAPPSSEPIIWKTCSNFHGIKYSSVPVAATNTALFSSPVPTGNDRRPPPRRTLKKRKNKRRQRIDQLSQKNTPTHDSISGLKNNDDFHHDRNQRTTSSFAGEVEYDYDDVIEVEIRPARRRDAVEAGLDYWIDEGDLERERERKKIMMMRSRNRKSTKTRLGNNAISQKKLREEVVAPYKQNWIGIFSVFIAALSAIGTKFPELLQLPIIPIPDL